MTPDLTADSIAEPIKQPPSTAGMTTKVVKGSMWTLGGSVLPLAVSFVSTPLIIRFLGAESYGVLLLVGLIPTYFSFADFGMSIASTKFASEAFGQGDEQKEAEVVWTAAAIAALSALIIATPLFLFSYPIVQALNVPEHMLSQASIALKITSGSFFLGVLASVLNSPMLARLRMDMNMLTSAVPKVLLAAVIPFILYLGYGIVGALFWSFIVAVGTLVIVMHFAVGLLPRLVVPVFNRDLIRPLLKFGGGWILAMIAAILLVNLEKLILTRLISVEALAFYSVAFTFASMATMFASSMIQSLGPAFAQLNAPEKKEEFDALFARIMRLNVIWLLPAIMLLFVIAKPFFTIWAGESFGMESTFPFYILLIGLFFNVLAYIPYSTLAAKGRTDIFAKVYWLELVAYALAALMLIKWLGITGAAVAYSLRVILDAFLIGWFAFRIAGVPLRIFHHFQVLGLGVAVLLPSMIIAGFYDNYTPWLLVSVPLSVIAYAMLIWRKFVEQGERSWITGKVHSVFDRSV